MKIDLGGMTLRPNFHNNRVHYTFCMIQKYFPIYKKARYHLDKKNKADVPACYSKV
jgi:hypothetical protein